MVQLCVQQATTTRWGPHFVVEEDALWYYF
jgi:hypothetical protein